MVVHRKSSANGPPNEADKQVTTLKTATTIIIAAAPPPPPVGVISSKAISITDACDYARRAAEFLEVLKNKEADREGNPFFL
jgi:hypothetical protein